MMRQKKIAQKEQEKMLVSIDGFGRNDLLYI